MSADTLRQAANKMREDHRHDAATGDVNSSTLVAVADWLDIMANPKAPGYRGPALAVALAYLGEPS